VQVVRSHHAPRKKKVMKLKRKIKPVKDGPKESEGC